MTIAAIVAPWPVSHVNWEQEEERAQRRSAFDNQIPFQCLWCHTYFDRAAYAKHVGHCPKEPK